MALLDLTINPLTKCNTYIRNPILRPAPPASIASIETRLSNLSSTETILKESTKYYENNLRQSGYNNKLTHKTTDTNHQKHSKHKRKIVWFNPPFSKNVSTKIGKSFLSL